MHTIAFMTEYCRLHGDNELEELTIADAFACLGGNTLSFCQTFKHVLAYEVIEKRFIQLKSNTEEFKNIEVFGQDCELGENGILSNTRPRDVIFLDPPWENPETRQVDDTVFTHAIDLCQRISQQTKTKYVFMKLPLRYSEREDATINNISNYDNMLTCMSDNWDDITINTLNRMKKWGPQSTYSIVCACRKQASSTDAQLSSAQTRSDVEGTRVRMLLMQLANLHA